MSFQNPQTTYGVSVAAVSATGGTYLGWLIDKLPPAISVLTGILSIIWFAIQIYESRSIRHWLRRIHELFK